MPIIIDNFQVNTNLPIDNRFVVGGTDSFYPNRDAIQHKYQGLRIWDLNVPGAGPYYWTGATWSSENAVGVSVDGTTSQGYLPVFTLGPTILGKSLLFQNSTNQIGIGISNVTLINPNIDLNGSNILITDIGGLHVNGNVKTNLYFVGKGDYITQLNATNVNTGFLDIARISNLQSSISGNPITPGSYVLFNTGSANGVTWKSSDTMSVLNATNATNVGVVSDTSSTSNYNITFVQATGNVPIKINSSKIQFKPSNGQLFLSNGSSTEPTYSFLNSTSGMYYDGYNINFTTSGTNRVAIRPGGITIYDSAYAQIDFYKNATDVQKLFVGQGNILKYRTNAWDSNNSIQLASDNVVWHSGNLYTLRNSGNLSVETGRLTNSISTDANGAVIKGIYTYNVYNTPITPSSQVHWSIITFGKGDEGSVQLASNWYGNNTQNGLVYADRDILLRSLRDTVDSWSPWVKIWNSGNSGYVPFGAIMMWSGQISQIPTGWRLCDGNNNTTITIPAGSVPGQPGMTSITIPDLRERFIVGAGGDNPNVDTFIYDSFTFSNPSISSFTTTPPTNSNGSYTRITTGTYYVDSTGKVQSGTLSNDYTNKYYVYAKTTGTQYYFIYDDRTGKENYILVQGSLPNVNNSIGTTSYEINSNYKKSVAQYDKNTRRIDLPGIIWPISFYSPGDIGGYNDIKLQVAQIPSHKHEYQDAFFSEFGNKGNNFYGTTAGEDNDNDPLYRYENPPGASFDAPGPGRRPKTYETGSSLSHENRPPYYALAFIIYTGI